MNTISTDTPTAAELRYEKNATRMAGHLTAWRTPERRRLLVRMNWGCVAIMAVITVAGYFWVPLVLAWVPMAVAVCTVWTMLRIVIDVKDSAPTSYLDEFETQALLRARSRALSVVSAILFVMAMVLIFVSTLELGDGHRLAYTAGSLSVLAIFVCGIVPAAAMARTLDPVDPDTDIDIDTGADAPAV